MTRHIRKLVLSDMDRVALVHRRAFDAALPCLAGLHTPTEDRNFYRGQVFIACDIWGALADDAIVGFMATRGTWIDQLYVLPEQQRHGIGGALLAQAKSNATELSLWTFQRNTRARRFYERHGFAAVRTTDGSGNEEREPDVLYRWIK